MNLKGQMDIHPIAFAGALLGGLFAVYMGKLMMAGTFMRITIFLITAVVCFFVTNLIMNKDE